MRKVLVLNASGVPLNLCGWTRAVTLLVKGKAEIVEHNGQMLAPDFPMPRVIQLHTDIRPYKSLAPSRENIFHRDGNTCQYCAKRCKEKALTLDHVFPRSRGGRNTWTNLVAACYRCNERKGDQTPEEARMPLLRVPYKPSSALAFEISRVAKSDEELRSWSRHLSKCC